ncbi:GUN4 domain-containing protein [Nostoc sp. XA010]|uniref:GUN4 domain-containing protein n=1 Tax=Nostoc sp. XA010 TaxID=2780407 RepID=UPI001E5D72B4|nr:GUN4 domain-containing protein [Nostoc sp. XA010]MCC5660848.1 GUN4 domain-containing protein [Nostoc sp. XA010]
MRKSWLTWCCSLGADRIKEGWQRESDITKFPQLDLQTIDSLWVKHSQERFGFSVQSCIWKNVEQDYGKFSDAVGWRLNYRWRQYSELIFKTEAPMGHLPAAPFFKSNLAIRHLRKMSIPFYDWLSTGDR